MFTSQAIPNLFVTTERRAVVTLYKYVFAIDYAFFTLTRLFREDLLKSFCVIIGRMEAHFNN